MRVLGTKQLKLGGPREFKVGVKRTRQADTLFVLMDDTTILERVMSSDELISTQPFTVRDREMELKWVWNVFDRKPRSVVVSYRGKNAILFGSDAAVQVKAGVKPERKIPPWCYVAMLICAAVPFAVIGFVGIINTWMFLLGIIGAAAASYSASEPFVPKRKRVLNTIAVVVFVWMLGIAYMVIRGTDLLA